VIEIFCSRRFDQKVLGPIYFYTSNHFTDIYTQYVDTDILLKITDRVTRRGLHRLSNINTLCSVEGCVIQTKWRKFKSETSLSTSISKGCPLKEIHADFMDILGKESSSYSTVEKCAAESKKGRESTGDDERPGRLKEATDDETVEAEHDLVMCDRTRDLRDIAREVGISFGSVQAILTDVFGMSKVSARLVPRQLTEDQ
jgi:hypothetical protein